MSERTASVEAKSSPSQAIGGMVLRRKCDCGKHAAGASECTECAKKRLQRKGSGTAAPSTVPQTVHDVLGSAGRPLEANTRTWMEPRFGSDFSRVRVHDDGKAAESARSVGALAYAVGNHVVFDHNQYAPSTPAGRRLLAHELAHTLQDPGASGLHTSLAIGQPNDVTEVAADRAADAVMRGERVSVAPTGGGVMRRQLANDCSAKPGEKPDERIVHCSDGSDTKVTMTASDGPDVPGFHGSVTPGANFKEIWLDIEVCRGGTEVHITPTIDIPQALASTIANAVAGSDALKGVTITPELKFKIIQNQSFTLSIDPSVKVGQGGVSGVGGSVKVETKDVTVTGGVNCNPKEKSCMFTLEFGGGKSTKDVNCVKKGKQKIDFICEKITHVPEVPEKPEEKRTDTETRYVFFRHAKHDVRKDFRLPPDIQTLNAQGYRVTSIKGFTSPEGPRGPEHMPQFEGNVELGKERAQAALDWLKEPKVCAGCDLTGAKVSGESELPPEQGKQEPEPKGPTMEHGAVDEFLGKTGKADPLAPSSPAEREKFERMPFSQQREKAFELMRRAEIVLERTRVVRERQPGVEAKDVPSRVDCDPRVLDVAKKSFGFNPPGPFNFNLPAKK